METYIYVRNTEKYQLTIEYDNKSYIIYYNVNMINPESLYLSEKGSMHDIFESLKQTSQQNPDVQELTWTIDKIGNIYAQLVYIDVKADRKGPNTGTISLIPHLADDYQIAKKYMNDATSYLSTFILKSSQSIAWNLQEYIDELKTIHANLTPTNISKQLELFNQLLFKASRNQLFIKAGLRLSMAESLEPIDLKETDFIEYMKETKSNIDLQSANIDITELYDRKIITDPFKLHSLVSNIMQKIAPIQYRNEFLNNYAKTSIRAIHDQ